jgi:hypothetical protein
VLLIFLVKIKIILKKTTGVGQAYKYRPKQNWESEAKRKILFSQKAKRSEANKKAKRSEQSEFYFQNWVKRSEAKTKRSEKKGKRSEKSFRAKFFGQFLRIKNMTSSSKTEIIIYASFMIFPKISPHFYPQPWI